MSKLPDIVTESIATDSDSSNKPASFLRTRAGKVTAFFCGIALAGGAASLFLLPERQNSTEHAPVGTQPVATWEATDSTEKNNDVPPINILDSELYKALSPDMQQTINDLRVMDTETFEAQLIDQKLMYASLLRDIYHDWAITQAKDNNYAKESLAVDNIPVITAASKGQEIVDDSAIVRCTQWYSMTVTSRGAPGALSQYRSDAVKMEALRVSPGIDIYKRDTNDIQTSPEFTSNLLCSGDMTVTSESPAITRKDGTVTKTVQGEMFNHTLIQETYNYVEFNDYQNKEGATWLLVDGTQKSSPSWISDLESLG